MIESVLHTQKCHNIERIIGKCNNVVARKAEVGSRIRFYKVLEKVILRVLAIRN